MIIMISINDMIKHNIREFEDRFQIKRIYGG